MHLSQDSVHTTSARSSGLIIVLYLLFLMGVVGIISSFLMSTSLRLDEAQSIWQTSHSLPETLRIVANDVHVPLYHILLHYWMILFGSGVVSVRSLSLAFFLASIPLLYPLARTLLSRRWSLTIVTIFSLSPFVSWYGSEARMYTLLLFFAILSQYFFVRILHHKPAWLGYGATVVIGVYSHYFFMFTLAAQALYFVLNYTKFKPGSFKRFVVVAVLAGASLAPWLYYFITQGAASTTRPAIQSPSTIDFFNTFSQFLFGFQTDVVNTIILSSWPLLVVIAFLTVRRGLIVSPTALYFLFASIAPILMAFVISFITTPFFLARYMIPAVAPLYIVIAWIISQYSRRVGIVVATIWLIVIGASFFVQSTAEDIPVREDYKAAARDIERRATSSDVVVLSAPFTVYPFEYYYNGLARVQTLPIWDRFSNAGIPAFSEQELASDVKTLSLGHDYIYLLTSHDQGYEEDVEQYFLRRYEQTGRVHYSDGLSLSIFRVGYNEIPRIEPKP